MPVNVSVLSLVMRSPAVPLSVENEAMVGAAGAAVSTVTFIDRRSGTGHASHRVGCGELMEPVRQGSRDKVPGPAGIRRRRAQQRCPVVDFHRAVRHRSAGQRQDRRIGNAIADNAGVRRERVDPRSSGGATTVTARADDAALVLPAASVAVAVKLWAALDKVPVVKLQAPLPFAVALPIWLVPSNTLTVRWPPPRRSGSARSHW